MSKSVLRAIILLPGTALVLIPMLLLRLTRRTPYAGKIRRPNDPLFWLALLLGGAGVGIAVWTFRLFQRIGKGTPAPWEPPKKLVVAGPYRHVRNPMISSVLTVLLAEALLFRSRALNAQMLALVLANAIYIPLVEEKALEARFGADYRTYKANVPRWLPRIRGWEPRRRGQLRD